MNVDIYRKIETSESITGEFWIDGTFQCYYLEPSRLTPAHPGHPCIPAGTYRVILTMSPHLGYVCPEVLDVPGRTAIRWHIGNFPKDVLGCCVVGTILGTDFVGNSRVAFAALMEQLQGQDITAEYHDPNVVPPGPSSSPTNVA
jgi:Steigviridae/Suoliviridae L,D-carboxypeptidase/transpeptidase